MEGDGRRWKAMEGDGRRWEAMEDAGLSSRTLFLASAAALFASAAAFCLSAACFFLVCEWQTMAVVNEVTMQPTMTRAQVPPPQSRPRLHRLGEEGGSKGGGVT